MTRLLTTNHCLTFVENTINNSPKVPRAKFVESDELFCFISICKFGSFKNSFARITSLSELYLDSVGTKEKIDFYELWQQHKLLKTTEMSEVWSDATFDEGYIHRF